MSNPPCPHCQHPKTHRNGKTRSGFQAYRCTSCRKRFSLNPTGRPLQGDAPVPGKERTAKWRERQKLKKQQQGEAK